MPIFVKHIETGKVGVILGDEFNPQDRYKAFLSNTHGGLSNGPDGKIDYTELPPEGMNLTWYEMRADGSAFEQIDKKEMHPLIQRIFTNFEPGP